MSTRAGHQTATTCAVCGRSYAPQMGGCDPCRRASQLLALAREYGETTPEGTRIPMRLTQTDLAGLAGASRVRVNQALGYFRKRGSISLDRDHRITVHDEEALARRAR